MSNTKKLWTILAGLLAVSFAVLLWSGGQIYQQKPPIPERLLTTDGDVVYTRDEIERGRIV